MADTVPPVSTDNDRPGTDRAQYHFDVIRRAISVIDEAPAPLSLDDLAARMGMSPAHFQRLFSAWVGISPKRYQQYLTVGHARRLLATRHTTLDTAMTTGLSGAGRLHDLFLRWEAMSPGDYATGGRGLTIRWAHMDTHFGDALVMATDRGLCGIAFTAETGPTQAWSDMTARWPHANYREDSAHVHPLAAPALALRGEARLHILGAPFQIKVWEALLNIPSGHVTTYSDIASAIGMPAAQRAVGTAVGRNPIAMLIPCHRVLRKDGAIGGYHWGLPVKRALLAWEAARADVAP